MFRYMYMYIFIFFSRPKSVLTKEKLKLFLKNALHRGSDKHLLLVKVGIILHVRVCNLIIIFIFYLKTYSTRAHTHTCS